MGVQLTRTDNAASIQEKIFANQHAPIVKPQAKPEPKMTVFTVHTPDQVAAALKAFTDKGVELMFLDDDMTWSLSYKGASDSGHMSTPINVIRWKAETVSKGARKPIVHEGKLYSSGF